LPEKRFGSASLMRQALRNAGRNMPATNFHRAPTLTDEWITNAASAPVEANEPDSVIILIEEAKTPQDWPEIVEVPEQPQPVQQNVKPGKSRSRRSRAAWYAFAALILMTLTTGLMLYRDIKPKPELLAGAAEMVSLGNASPDVAATNVPMRQEIISYYLEVVSPDSVTARATGMMPLALDSRFKFHFKPRQSGYIYLMALGKNDRLQTFLTEKPMPATGATTNWSVGGNDFQFPDSGQWFMLPQEAESAPFTIIFSHEPLKSPGFLSMPSGHELNEAELQELAELRKHSSSISPNLVAYVEDNQPAVAVQVLAERYKNEPLVFDLIIKKK